MLGCLYVFVKLWNICFGLLVFEWRLCCYNIWCDGQVCNFGMIIIEYVYDVVQILEIKFFMVDYDLLLEYLDFEEEGMFFMIVVV